MKYSFSNNFKRGYFIITFGIWIATIVSLEYLLKIEPRAFFFLLVQIPFQIPNIYIVASLLAFQFSYSDIGQKNRTQWPDQEPIALKKNTSGRIGWLNGSAPFFSFAVFPSGFGISAMNRKGFLPKEQIIEIKKQFLRYKVIHKSVEIRSPIIFKNKKIFTKLKGIITDEYL